MKAHTSILLFGILIPFIISCGPKKSDQMNEPETETIQAIMYETDTIDVYTFKTYYQTTGKVDSVIVSSDKVLFVAIPEVAMSRQAGMTDTLSSCLTKCKQPDGSHDLNCILRCPSKVRLKAISR